MKHLILFFALAMVSLGVDAQHPGELITAQSRSGQFSSRAVRQHAASQAGKAGRVPVAGGWAFMLNAAGPGSATEAGELQVDPALIVISCERLKQSLLIELGMPDQWRGKISLLVDSSMARDEEPALTAIWSPGGWSYELLLPNRIKNDRLFRSLVHVLLLEIANRESTGESAQLPLWLVQGVTSHLQANNLPTLLLQPESSMVGNRVRLLGLEMVRSKLAGKSPLSFQELSWPTQENVGGKDKQIYEASAQLFVYELLHFKDGRTAMRQTVQTLAHNLNWQIPFLHAFHLHFRQLVDVEKWWGLACVSFATRDLSPDWNLDQSLGRLQEALDIPVQVHLDAERLPADAVITLQEVVSQWQVEEQKAALQRTMDTLLLLRPRLAPPAAVLADKYRALLDSFLHEREARRFVLHGKREPSGLVSLKKTVCKQLSQLDAQRSALRLTKGRKSTTGE